MDTELSDSTTIIPDLVADLTAQEPTKDWLLLITGFKNRHKFHYEWELCEYSEEMRDDPEYAMKFKFIPSKHGTKQDLEKWLERCVEETNDEALMEAEVELKHDLGLQDMEAILYRYTEEELAEMGLCIRALEEEWR